MSMAEYMYKLLYGRKLGIQYRLPVGEWSSRSELNCKTSCDITQDTTSENELNGLPHWFSSSSLDDENFTNESGHRMLHPCNPEAPMNPIESSQRPSPKFRDTNEKDSVSSCLSNGGINGHTEEQIQRTTTVIVRPTQKAELEIDTKSAENKFNLYPSCRYTDEAKLIQTAKMGRERAISDRIDVYNLNNNNKAKCDKEFEQFQQDLDFQLPRQPEMHSESEAIASELQSITTNHSNGFNYSHRASVETYGDRLSEELYPHIRILKQEEAPYTTALEMPSEHTSPIARCSDGRFSIHCETPSAISCGSESGSIKNDVTADIIHCRRELFYPTDRYEDRPCASELGAKHSQTCYADRSCCGKYCCTYSDCYAENSGGTFTSSSSSSSPVLSSGDHHPMGGYDSFLMATTMMMKSSSVYSIYDNHTTAASMHPYSFSSRLEEYTDPALLGSHDCIGGPELNGLMERFDGYPDEIKYEGYGLDSYMIPGTITSTMDCCSLPTGKFSTRQDSLMVVSASLRGRGVAHRGSAGGGRVMWSRDERGGGPEGTSRPSGGNSGLLCAVCGDNAACQHYGVRTCEGCKGFFKRTVQKRSKYVCLSGKNCPVDKRRRNRCQYCRFQKCLSVGMVREVVRTDSLKGRRGRLPSKPKSIQINPKATSPPINLLTSLVRAHVESSPDHNNLNYAQFTQPHFQRDDSCLQDSITSHAGQLSTSPSYIVQLVNDVIASCGDVIESWANKVPGFRDLNAEDRRLLFVGSFLEIFVLRMAQRMISLKDEAVTVCSGIVLHRTQCAHGFGGWMDAMVDLAAIMSRTEAGLTDVACLTALSLFTVRPGLQDEKRVEHLQAGVLDALRQHCTYNSVSADMNASNELSAVLSLIPHVQSVARAGLDRIVYLNNQYLSQQQLTQQQSSQQQLSQQLSHQSLSRQQFSQQQLSHQQLSQQQLSQQPLSQQQQLSQKSLSQQQLLQQQLPQQQLSHQLSQQQQQLSHLEHTQLLPGVSHQLSLQNLDSELQKQQQQQQEQHRSLQEEQQQQIQQTEQLHSVQHEQSHENQLTTYHQHQQLYTQMFDQQLPHQQLVQPNQQLSNKHVALQDQPLQQNVLSHPQELHEPGLVISKQQHPAVVTRPPLIDQLLYMAFYSHKEVNIS